MCVARLLLTAMILLGFQSAFSQGICGFDFIHHQMMQDDTAYRNRILRNESNLRKSIKELGQLKPGKNNIVLGGPPYIIPVVIHVVTTGGAIGTIYNPTDAQIQGAIDYLNQVYNGTYPGIGGAGDLGIQFVLAKRDPNCNPTTGIERIDGSVISNYTANGVSISGGPGTNEINVKNLSRWSVNDYYNIWLVDKINGNDGTSGTFIAGYAYFPGSPSALDGTVMLATQMISGQKTLPHEIGHAFNLYHPFEGSPDKNTCPQNLDCTADGDQVCDTDPITYNQLAGTIDFTCRTGNNSCTGTNYNANTENNFMNYTSCFNLFTAGQKIRMQASAASPDRIALSNSLGGLAPDINPTCAPKINFELDGDQVSETTIAASGCRKYKDFTYNMTIGSAPSFAATATIHVNPITATEGVDFDITTNGDFISPSKTLNFPGGSTTSQSFIVRVYDDASVEGSESFSLDFVVNPGAGNAEAGTGKPVFTMVILDNDVAPTAGTTPNGIASIGTAAATIGAGPFNATLQSQRVQFQYTAAELTAAGIPAGYISSISLFVQSKLTSRAFTGLNIKLGKSTVANLINGSVTAGSSMTTVRSLASYTTVAGWNDFPFDSPYLWDGTSNLVVEYCFDNGSISAGAGADLLSAYFDGSGAAQGNFFLQNGIDCSTSFSSVSYYGSGRKPILRLSYGIAQTTVDTTLNTSRQEWLGPNTDIYFYDQANSQLMARINNTGNFDYGCTQVLLDRSGNSASPFWNNTPANFLMDKTFKVIPANNNASGAYTITFYYTQAEVNGWQSATGQNINNIQLVKTTNAISLVTPGNPGSAGTILTALPSISTIGTNTGLSYSFNTGFSGFGAGIIGTVLPITLIQFDGAIVHGHAQLNWTSSSEENSRGFDIERSLDGKTFEKIGWLASVGNSSGDNKYQFSDKDLAAEINYYRLKLYSQDNQFQYSNTILLKNTITSNDFRVLTNPFTNSIEILLDKPVNGRVISRLLDMTGKEIYKNVQDLPFGNRISLDISGKNISAGVYILDLTSNNERHIQRLVKQ